MTHARQSSSLRGSRRDRAKRVRRWKLALKQGGTAGTFTLSSLIGLRAFLLERRSLTES